MKLPRMISRRAISLSAVLLSALTFSACSGDSGTLSKATSSNSDATSSSSFVPVPVDYSLGRAMNARLGRGMNLGNSWDSKNYGSCGDKDCNIPGTPYNNGYDDWLDGGWNNPIDDGDFVIIKNAGFNSVRIPVRWQHNSDPVNHTVSPERLAGVVEDVQLAISQGLAVVVDFHWYQELMNAANNYSTDPAAYEAEKLHFLSIWAQVATTLNAFPDSLLVLEILNEPTISNADVVNDVMLSAYNVIRSAAPGKTIMFESYHASKFADLGALRLPQDGNIIFSGHYYEPYTFTHEGHGYNCQGNSTYNMTAKADFAKYVALAEQLYPDVNGGHIPLNMGEFGVAAGERSDCGSEGPTDAYFARWSKDVVAAVEKYDISWHYWGFTRVGGFEAYDRDTESWYPGILEALLQQ